MCGFNSISTLQKVLIFYSNYILQVKRSSHHSRSRFQ